VELIFLIPLLKDGANSESRGITVDNELVFELGLTQDGGSADSVNESSERCFMFVIPIKLPSLRTMSYKRVERCGQDAKSTDIHPIEV
jgi:hypothetical protein